MPTIKQRIAVEKLSEIIRNSKGQKNITLGRVMKAAGYSETSSLRPSAVTNSKGFMELLKEKMPDDKVIQLQSDLMESSRLDSYKVDAKLTDKEIEEMVEGVKGCKVRKILRFKSDSFVTVYFYAPDNNTRKVALDMFYKLTNKYPKDKEESDANSSIKNYLDKLAQVLP